MASQHHDRDAIVEVCTRMAWYADQRQWERFDEVFADRVRLDYTSMIGGEPTEVAREEVVASWRGTLEGLDATQHLVGNHLVDSDGETAVCTASFQAAHLLANPHGGPLWILGGTYRYELIRTAAGWRIRALTMTAVWAQGNQHIMALAAVADRRPLEGAAE